jgi:8-oxo-dGTP pyrophosphatase MutT (NUDIX family)
MPERGREAASDEAMVDADRLPAPRWLLDDATRFAEAGGAPVVPRNAATVVLMRPSTAGGFEVYLQRRAATMAFAPNMYVFPGGTVDPRDAEGEVNWAGPPPSAWAARLGLGESDARAIVCAAVREVFEECGVLLAGPSASTVVGDVSGDDWESARVSLLAREVALVELLAARGLAVRSDLLAPFARWLTPEFEPRRFDTFFFLARLPGNQVARDVGGEADHSTWLPPAEAMALRMLPPTAHTLRLLSAAEDFDGAVAARAGQDLTRPVMPRVYADEDGTWLTISPSI